MNRLAPAAGEKWNSQGLGAAQTVVPCRNQIRDPRVHSQELWKKLPQGNRDLLDKVLKLRIVSPTLVGHFLDEQGDRLPQYSTVERLGAALVQAGLLTTYQVDRVLAGTTHGLVLGNYRILDRIGVGGMGVVFVGEHSLMKRRVAVKVLPVDEECPSSLRERFYSEMRVLAELHHPNIVHAYDAGELAAPHPNMPSLIYLVMELVTGGDLDQHVQQNGPCPIAQACDWISQAACGLQESHNHHLVHRDVKPSNLLLNAQGQIKLVDFGLARRFCSRLTHQKDMLGTIQFMAPEQSHDPSAVGGEADIYGLGATFFWLLTGQAPYPDNQSLAESLKTLQEIPPRRLRDLRPDIPAELDRLVQSMLERNPACRPVSALAVMNALSPFQGSFAASVRKSQFIDNQPSPMEETGKPEPFLENVLRTNRELEHSLQAREADVREAQDAFLFAVAKMAESRDGETPGHMRRLQLYCRRLAEWVANDKSWAGLVDERFLTNLERCVPLHDIGKIALPEDLLLKPGALTVEERRLMETHTLIGDRLLEALGRKHGKALAFLGMARGIVRHHHERFDGTGYPDHLAGDDIPPAARLVALADVYDALRRQRFHKPAWSHQEAIAMILSKSPGQFDASLLAHLVVNHKKFEQIFREAHD